MTPTAYMYTCRNLGQVALLWPSQRPPTGPGWIEVKRVGLVSVDEVSEVVRNGEKCVTEFNVYESALSSLLPGTYYMDPPDGGDVPLIEQIRRMAQDAARYRWLRDDEPGRSNIFDKFETDNLDYAIDQELLK